MRKFILTAVIALGFSTATQGQTADSNATPTKPTDCTENENFPAIGVPHEYAVEISSGSPTTTPYSGDGLYNWYVTQNPELLLKEDDVKVVPKTNDFFDVKSETDFSVYHEKDVAKKATTKNKIGLTWKPGALLNADKKYFLVLKYKEHNGTCDAMNVKVMKIEPLNQFKLVIDPVQDENGTAFVQGKKAEVCASDVVGAKYADNKVKYTYGENTLYYKITASGFAGEWKPRLKVPALSDDTAKGKQKYVKAEWIKKGDDPADDTKWHTFNIGQTNAEQELTSTDLAEIPLPAAGDTPTQDYIIRIVVDNQTFETLEDQTLNVATDGTIGGDHTLDDETKSLQDQKDGCNGKEDKFFDKDDYTIKARPTVKATSGGFVQHLK